ncbi:hypothetical protein LUX12_05480 [Streptomyces somaliensis]|uniref:hypothetical protein n=1 Tax=Streptomyces somaliensis TaxID=78355 RepID=UPI0020CCE075|nr:hypothetical protein [Streptomyces somaliensis]MCP9944365.1 hypothetical protein [Streptomyces somaliensis]MCP9962400.1 hypothetical protein [Streptomyces somaliensis]MCP9975218.1 hypothetical protein [Streptomyces somaliensis]
MDKATVREIIHRAQESGRIPSEALYSIMDEFDFEAGQVNREIFLHTYRRRLKRTLPGSVLHGETSSLVDFLEAHHEESLTMIGIRPKRGGFDAFLADQQAHEVLFWMRMFSQHQEDNRE